MKTTNKTSNNLKTIKINSKPAINSSINNIKAISLNINNGLRGNIAQELKINIENLNFKSVDLNQLTSNKETIKISIEHKNLIKSEIKNNISQEECKTSNTYDSILTFSSLLKGFDLNLAETKLNNLSEKSPVVSEYKILGKVIPKIKYASNPKLVNSGLFMSLNSTTEFYSCLTEALKYITDNKSKITTSSDLNSEGGLNKENNKVISYKIRHYLNLITKYDFNLATSYYDFFQFKKSNKYLFKMEKAAELLKLAFLTKGCLISKPIFNVVYPQISVIDEENEQTPIGFKNNSFNKPRIRIHLFYYIKTEGLLDNELSSVLKAPSLNEEHKPNNFISEEYKNLSFNKSSDSISKISANNYITTVYEDKFTYLCDYLTKLFNTEVELELVRLYRPYQDSNILVQYLNSESYNIKFIRIASRLFRRIKIYRRKKFLNLSPLQGLNDKNALNTKVLNEPAAFPSGISGINIKLAGRPFKERIVPRFTVKRAQRGNFDRLNVKMIERSMFTDKNKKGAFNFTVRLSHIFR